MQETKKKNRGWVKTAAIIFLAVMLVLTFLSNTIMNWSLPEVSGQYAGYGTISTAIRGSGSVQANMAYSIQIEQTRRIRSVLVKVGDKVEAGEAVFLLDDADSEELQAAIDTLEEMKYNYSVKLLQNLPENYSEASKNIQHMKEDLAQLEKDKSEISVNAAALAQAEAASLAAQNEVDMLTEAMAALDERLAELGDVENSFDPVFASYVNKLNAAKENLAMAEVVLSEKETELSRAQESLPGDYDYLQTQVLTLTHTVEDMERELAYKEADLELLKSDPEATVDAITQAERQIERDKTELLRTKNELEALKNDLAIAQEMNTYVLQLENECTAARYNVDMCKLAVEAAQKDLDNQTGSISNQLKMEKSMLKDSLKAANAALTAAKKAEAEAAGKMTMTEDQADEQIKSLRRQIESAVAALQQQQEADGIANQITNLELEQDKKAIEEQEALVEELRGNGEGTEVTARYAGVISAINVVAGDTATPGNSLASLDVEGKGYTLSIPVTNEQAKMVQVGAKANVIDYWFGSVDVTLTAIKADKGNPAQRLLEFEVTGDITEGQSLNISIGDRQTSYDVVVPNSAVKEDSNGKFIYVAVAKSTPLGNRYTATRVDVNVVAKDNYFSAIESQNEYGYEYVITTSTKPLDNGMLVRLAEDSQ